MTTRISGPDTHALARQAARALPGREDAPLSALSTTERAQVARTVAHEQKRALADVVADLVPLWGENVVDRGRAAEKRLGTQVASRGASSSVDGVELLAPELRALPAPLQKLCVELDRVWGNADGKVSVEEFDRVARYVLSALPFFTKEAGALLELAQALGYASVDDGKKPQLGPQLGRGAQPTSLFALRVGLQEIKPADVEKNEPFRALFDEAVLHAAKEGGPELIRDVAFHQPKWHALSILEHTGKAVEAVRALASSAGVDWHDAGAIMLLHDVGKLIDRHETTDENGKAAWHFRDHEELGAQWLEARGLDPALVFHVRTHGDIRHRSVDEILRLCGGDVTRVREFVLVALADTLAKGATPDLVASAKEICAKVEDVCTRAGGKAAGLDGRALTDQYRALRAEWFGA